MMANRLRGLFQMQHEEEVVPEPVFIENPPPSVLDPLFKSASNAHWDYLASPECDLASNNVAVGRILGQAMAENDAEALRTYAEFPILCDHRYKYLITLMRAINEKRDTPISITPEIISAYRRAGELYDGPVVQRDPNRHEFVTYERKMLQEYVILNMDRAETILSIVNERGIKKVDEIETLLLLGNDAPALRDGVL